MSIKRLCPETKCQAIVTGILVTVTLLSGGLLASDHTYADDDSIVEQVSISIPISCSLIGSGMNSHTVEVTNGTYRSEIGTTTLKAFCNDTGGFAIYAIGFTGDSYDSADHTKLIGTNTNEKIITGTATTAGNPDVSNWAMKLATSSGATYPITLDNSYGSYSVVPDTYTKVAHRDGVTDVGVSATGAELTTTYAAYISKTQPADTYTGKVKYTLVHPSTETPLHPETTQAGKICYYPNGSGVVGTMGCQNVASSIDLLASNFSRAGYGFAGWNDKFDYTGTFYGPQETVALNTADYSTTGLSLYAVWVKSAGSLQDSSKVATLCGTGAGSLTTAPTDGTANLSSVSALTDQRDSQTYAIAKLADGKCWMIENLRLEAEDTRSDDNRALAQGYGISTTYGDFSGLADAESENFSNSTTANSLYSTDGSNDTINIGSSNNPGYRMPRYNNLNTPASASNRPQNPTSNTYSNDNTTVGMYSYGNYYTWSAAMANTIYYSGPNATDADGKTSDNVNTSICPSGWRLPYGSTTSNGNTAGGFYYLNYKINNDASVVNAIASNKLRSYPNNFLYSGRFGASSAVSRGAAGYYFSSTVSSSNGSYSLNLISTYVGPGNDLSYRHLGYSIRCVALSS